MAMDLLRRYNFTPTEIGAERGRRVRLRWYRCLPGALAFPFPHAFAHPAYEKPDTFPEEGPGCGHWQESAKPAYLPLPGQHFHGPADWFANGIPESAFANIPPPTDTFCGIASPIVGGGGVAGGEAGLAQQVAISADGGGVALGNALVSVPQRSAGGEVEGGGAVQGLRNPQPGQGGEVEGGSADQAVLARQPGQGGEVEGGQAAQLGGAVQPGQGGEVEGGSADQAVLVRQPGQGGEVEGGSADQAVLVRQPGQGGEVEGGQAVQGSGHLELGDGGGVAGGAATVQTAAVRAAVGGSVAGGTSRVGIGQGLHGDGGSVAGGEVVIYPPQKSEGGEVDGGTAEQSSGGDAGLAPCPHLALGASVDVFRITYSGWPADMPFWNDPRNASRSRQCEWVAQFDSIRQITLRWDGVLNGWVVELSATGGAVLVQHFSASFDGTAATVFTEVFNNSGAQADTTALVEPE